MGSSPTSATSLSPIGFRVRPGGQAVKTPPFHGGNTSSILVRVTKNPECKSVRDFLIYQRTFFIICRYGGIGRRAGLRNRWATVQVRPLLPAPNKNNPNLILADFWVRVFFLSRSSAICPDVADNLYAPCKIKSNLFYNKNNRFPCISHINQKTVVFYLDFGF